MARNDREYQAIFSIRHGGDDGSYGETVHSIEEALECEPGADEYLSGIRTRRVEPWAAVSLVEILKVKGVG